MDKSKDSNKKFHLFISSLNTGLNLSSAATSLENVAKSSFRQLRKYPPAHEKYMTESEKIELANFIGI